MKLRSFLKGIRCDVISKERFINFRLSLDCVPKELEILRQQEIQLLE